MLGFSNPGGSAANGRIAEAMDLDSLVFADMRVENQVTARRRCA
jgi:hypothetical protein